MSDLAEYITSDFPLIPGLRLRHFERQEDYLGMAAVREPAGEYDRVDRRSAREGIPSAADLANTFPWAAVNGSPDSLLVEQDAALIGYCHVWWRWVENTGVRVYLHLGYLLPEWRGRGIGRGMVRWAEERIRAIARAELADDGAMFATNVSTTEPQADALMMRMGYIEVRRLTDMALDLTPVPFPSPPLPGEVVLKPVEPDQYRSIYAAWKDALQEFWTSTPESEQDYQEFMASTFSAAGSTPDSSQVAWVGNSVVGYVLVARNPSGGIIDEVGVRHAWQRRGIGRALMTRALTLLGQGGVRHVRLFTNAADERGARTLYEQLGFREVKQHLFYRKPI